MNFKNAFLNGELDEEIYMDQTEDFLVACQRIFSNFDMKDMGGESYVLRVKIHGHNSRRIIDLS